jgi:hypothetical protein
LSTVPNGDAVDVLPFSEAPCCEAGFVGDVATSKMPFETFFFAEDAPLPEGAVERAAAVAVANTVAVRRSTAAAEGRSLMRGFLSRPDGREFVS